MIPAIVEALGPSLDNKNQPLQIHTQARIPDVYARKIEREIWSLSNTINSAKTVEIAGLYDSMVSAYEQLQHTEFGLHAWHTKFWKCTNNSASKWINFLGFDLLFGGKYYE